MKIGIIIDKNGKECHHSIYYFAGLIKCCEVKEIYCNQKLKDQRGWFPVDENKINYTTIQEIESRIDLDFVFYGWTYIKRPGVYSTEDLPKAKSPRIMMNLQDGITFTTFRHNLEFLKQSDLCFKISLAKDKEMYYMPEKRPECFKIRQIPKDQIYKLKPLMYVGSYGLHYPEHPFTNEYKISFTGAKTSLDRIKSVCLLMDKYKQNFHGGLMKWGGQQWTTNEPLHDEDGSQINNIEILEKYKAKFISKKYYLEFMRNSTVSFSPAGYGRNTHRFIDILCTGGACLVADVSHIDYGQLGPKENEHYLSYKKDQSDLIEKVEHLLNNKDKAEAMGNRAREHMKQTYCNNEKMAREYILKELK